jgi:uncharacterized protein (DUF4415 family)
MTKQKKKKGTSSRFRKIPHPRIYREEEIGLSNAKVNIHIRLDAEVVNYFKEKAQQEGSKYQTLINQHLRESIFKQSKLEDRLKLIEQRLRMH